MLSIEFSAKAIAKTTFFLIPNSKVPYKAPITAQAPPLSMYIDSIDPEGFKLRPPVSNVIPLPTKATSTSLLSLLP